MIQSISSSKITKTNNYADIKSKSATQISFTGFNTSNISKNIINDVGSKVEKKALKLAKELTNTIKDLGNKFKKNNELPFVEKPIILASGYNGYDDRTIKLLKELERLGIEVDNLDRHPTGGLYGLDKAIIKDKINRAAENGKISDKKAEEIRHQVSMCGNKHDESLVDNVSPSIANDRASIGENSYDKVREEMDRIQKSPWLTDSEKEKEISEIITKANDTVADQVHHHPIWEKTEAEAGLQDAKHIPNSVADDVVPPENSSGKKGFFHELWDTLFGERNHGSETGADDVIDLFKY